MTSFYNDLKELRQGQKIELSEVANRTKINIQYLEALEKGDFSFLPLVYVRLFLRAYAVEIGADKDDILNQLEIHLENSGEGTLPKNQPATEEAGPAKFRLVDEDDEIDEDHEIRESTPFQMRASLVKVAVLLIVVFFAVYIVRRIVTEAPVPAEGEITVAEEVKAAEGRITDRFLLANYNPDRRVDELLLPAPFSLTLSSRSTIWYEYIMDGSNPVSGTVPPGDEIVLEFESFISIRIEKSSEVQLKLNDASVSLDPLPNPTDVFYRVGMGQLTVISYTPR